MKKLILVFTFMMATLTFSEMTYFQVGVTPTLNLCEGDTVTGLRIPMIFGKTNKVTGIDFNLLAGETYEFMGFQGGIFLGAGIVSKVNYKFRGVGFNMVNLQNGDSKGILVGVGNFNNDFTGFRMGLLNYSRETSSFEIGIINYSKETFFQLGLINIAKDIQGVQIGVLNFAENGVLPVIPFINFNLRI
jgi:hypothetical protein